MMSHLGAAQSESSDISFTIRNAGVGIDGRFEETRVEHEFIPNDLENSFFKLVISATTINTGIKARDKHLRKSKYFDVENYPELTFKSTKISKTEDGYSLSGELTMKATTLPVEIPFTIEDQEGKQYFIGYVELDRRDYKVGKNHLILGDLVKVNIKVPYSEN